MWNFGSYPKWIYHTPFVEFAHIFEMPLLGYFPFGLKLYPLTHLLLDRFAARAVGWRDAER